MVIILIWKNGKIHLEMCETSIFSLFIQLYIAKVPVPIESGSGENSPDPTKKVRILPDPQPWLDPMEQIERW